MKVYLGTDHRGFALKEKIKDFLLKSDFELEDLGAYEFDPEDDYTHYAERVASMVAENPGARGILLCGSGVGVDVTANKFDGVRASIGKDKNQVKAGREDDDMNILVIAADFTKEGEAEEMVNVFLKTDFQSNTRHKRRLSEIKKIEANN